MRYSGNVRKNLECLRIFFNEKSVVILTRRDIPVQVKFIASLGKSFNYCRPIEASSMIDLFVCMNEISMNCDRYEELYDVNHEFNDAKRLLFNEDIKDDEPAEAQLCICDLLQCAAEFLRKNKSIVIVSSDKGGEIVIMDREDYMQKANAYLGENVIAGNYELINNDLLATVRPLVEMDYVNIIAAINPYLIVDGVLKVPLESEPFIIPLFYGCPKIHKDDVPLRPVIAAADIIGNFLSSWLFGRLQLIADHFNRYDVLNSESLVPELKSFKLELSHRLCSLDYVSMFTNVDIDECSLIIGEYYDAISETSSVPAEVFMKCPNFFTKDATFFVFL